MKLSRMTNLPLGILTLILLASRQHCVCSEVENDSWDQTLNGTFSTNWAAAAKASLPAQYGANGNLNFQKLTNLLSQESLRENVAAQTVYGFTLVVLSHSPQEAEPGIKLLSGAAAKGDITAMMRLGVFCEVGKYVRQDYTQAFHWFGLAADKHDSEGQLQLGGCYFYGFGTSSNPAMAAQYYHLSAEQTNYRAMKSYGYHLMNGLGVEKDLKTAKYWFLRAAKEGGNRRAMYNLGVLGGMDFPDTNAMAESFQWYKQSAELGDALACDQVANYYYNGWGGAQQNLASYYHWLLQAAKLGATDAQYFMGAAYRRGDSFPKDTESSLFWYQKAAAKNHPIALYDLAVYYLQFRTNEASLTMASNYMCRAAQAGNREAEFQCALSSFRGDAAPVDCENGNHWLTQAAEAGWGKAEFILFQCYFNGVAPCRGCPPYAMDKVEAIKWIRRAANHGVFQAQSTFAVMLIRGRDVEIDKVTAEKLLRDAAKHGYAEAQNDLGFSIASGEIDSVDTLEATMWIKLAESHATDPNTLRIAELNLSKASSQLNADQQLEVDQRVKNFQPIPVTEIDPVPVGWQNNPSYQQEDGKYGH